MRARVGDADALEQHPAAPVWQYRALEVIADAPNRLTREFLDEHKLALVVHGDDVGHGAEVYEAAAETGRLRLVPRTESISTPDLIARVRSRTE